MSQRRLSFSVDSALLSELGEKLVETVHVALVELVKNSYDADASKVEIVFTKNGIGKSEIHIIDDGKGMNFRSVQKYWMRIATTNKGKTATSVIYGRPLTGAKGIGRFSCRRLGACLTLITIGTAKNNVSGEQEQAIKTEVEFDWHEFRPGTDVNDIENTARVSIVKKVKTGTTLIISEISEEWDTRGWNWLKRQLSVLAANTGAKRKGFSNDPGFTIKIIAPEFEGGVRDLREDYINAGWGTLTASINEEHRAVCELDAKGIGKRTITSVMQFPSLKDITLKIGIMVGERDQMRNTSNMSLANMQAILPEWGGVQVRYKNFRVFPYGDDDWLDIDKDRGIRKGKSNENELLSFAETLKGVDPSRSLLSMLSMRSYLGSVFIGEGAKGFEMKLNREGFVQSKEFDQLKLFTRYAIDWSTILRDFYIRQKKLEQSRIVGEEFENIIHKKLEPANYIGSAITYLQKQIGSIVEFLPVDERENIEKSFLKATDVIRTHNETNKAELQHLRLVASTSTLLLVFSHEVKSLLGLLEQNKNSLNNVASRLSSKEQNRILEITSGFTDLKVRLEELLEMTSLVGAESRQAKPGQIALKPKLAKTTKIFSLITNKYNIGIDYENVPNNIVIKNILEAEVYSIFLNILSNAIKSVIAGGINRKIEISAAREKGINTIRVRDSGLGLSKEEYEDVFIPFISDPKGRLYYHLEKRLNPEDKLIVGSGSGLGLGIVKEIVNAHEGSVRFIEPLPGWSAEIEIKLP